MKSSDKKIKVIFLTKAYPFPARNGAAMRDAGLFQQLEKEFRAELLTVLAPHEAAPRAEHGASYFVAREPSPLYRRVWNPLLPYVANGFARNVVDALRQRFEPGAVLWISRLSLGRYARAGKEIGYRVVIDEHNVESDYYLQAVRSSRKWLELPLALQLHWWEKRICRSADEIVATSERDARLLAAFGLAKEPIVIPNCVEKVYRGEPSAPAAGLLFTGTLDYAPNVEAIHWLLAQVWPSLKNLSLRIVGARPSAALKAECSRAGAEIHADVPSLAPFYEEASICLAPIFSGGGTRLKILEALAHGKALIATSKAAEGLDLRDGEDFILANDREQFLRAIKALTEDPALASSIGARGRDRIAERYLWEAHRAAIAGTVRGEPRRSLER